MLRSYLNRGHRCYFQRSSADVSSRIGFLGKKCSCHWSHEKCSSFSFFFFFFWRGPLSIRVCPQRIAVLVVVLQDLDRRVGRSESFQRALLTFIIPTSVADIHLSSFSLIPVYYEFYSSRRLQNEGAQGVVRGQKTCICLATRSFARVWRKVKLVSFLPSITKRIKSI